MCAVFLIFFGFAGFLRQMDSKVYHLKVLQFAVYLLEKRRRKKPVHLPLALLLYGLLAGIIR